MRGFLCSRYAWYDVDDFFMPSSPRSPSLGFWLLLLVGTLFFVGYAGRFYLMQGTEARPPVESSPTITSAMVTSSPMILFSEEVGAVTGTNRSWRVVAAYEKRGAEPAKKLFQVGSVGEYPKSIRLSPDKQFLLVDLESKLQRYTFATDKLEDLYIAKQGIGGVDFSPDGKELFIWDQAYPAIDKRYYARRLELSTSRTTLVASGLAEAMVDPSWLPNNVVILHQAMGAKWAIPWRLSLSTGEFVQVKEGLFSGYTSQTGKLMAVSTAFIGDACNDFSGDTESGFDLVETDTGNKVAAIDGRGKAVRFYAFSPDDRQALYSLYTPFSDREQCEGSNPLEDPYLLSIATGGRERVSDPQALVWRWYNTSDARVRMKYDQDKGSFTVFLDEQPVIESLHNLNFIGTR